MKWSVSTVCLLILTWDQICDTVSHCLAQLLYKMHHTQYGTPANVPAELFLVCPVTRLVPTGKSHCDIKKFHTIARTVQMVKFNSIDREWMVWWLSLHMAFLTYAVFSILVTMWLFPFLASPSFAFCLFETFKDNLSLLSSINMQQHIYITYPHTNFSGLIEFYSKEMDHCSLFLFKWFHHMLYHL